jgi:hypothetical protein
LITAGGLAIGGFAVVTLRAVGRLAGGLRADELLHTLPPWTPFPSAIPLLLALPVLVAATFSYLAVLVVRAPTRAASAVLIGYSLFAIWLLWYEFSLVQATARFTDCPKCSGPAL